MKCKADTQAIVDDTLLFFPQTMITPGKVKSIRRLPVTPLAFNMQRALSNANSEHSRQNERHQEAGDNEAEREHVERLLQASSP